MKLICINPQQLCLTLLACLFCLCHAAAAQTPDYQAELNNFGQPDISGFWQVLNTAAYNVEPHTASTGVPAGLGVIIDPADGLIPYTTDALAKRNANFAMRFSADPLRHCYKPGVPRLVYLSLPFQIVQTADQVVMLYEYVHNTRTVYLKRTEHLDGIEFWNGDSTGHFAGSTLQVHTSGFIGETWLDQAGNHHSPMLQVSEKFTPIGPNHLRYEATLEDPLTYTRPWTMSMILYRHMKSDMRILEYECHAYAEDDAASKAE